jgi:hypothetical protein
MGTAMMGIVSVEMAGLGNFAMKLAPVTGMDQAAANTVGALAMPAVTRPLASVCVLLGSLDTPAQRSVRKVIMELDAKKSATVLDMAFVPNSMEPVFVMRDGQEPAAILLRTRAVPPMCCPPFLLLPLHHHPSTSPPPLPHTITTLTPLIPPQ